MKVREQRGYVEFTEVEEAKANNQQSDKYQRLSGPGRECYRD